MKLTTAARPPRGGGTLTMFLQGRAVELEVAAGESDESVAQRVAAALEQMKACKPS